MDKTYKTVRIPLFPFTNRTKERELMLNFVDGMLGNRRILLIEAEAGLGKSRLLEQFNADLGDDYVSVRLNFEEFGGKAIGLFNSIKSETLRLRNDVRQSKSLKSELNISTDILKIAKQLVPAAGAAVPFAGKLVQRALELLFDDNDPEYQENPEWLILFVTLCTILSKERKVLICVNDYHELADDEKKLMFELIGLITENSENNIRVIITTRPLPSDEYSSNNLTGKFAEEGELLIKKLAPLNTSYLADVSELIFNNPETAKPLLESANGNPQQFRELLIKMNMRGELSVKSDRIQLPDVVNILPALSKDQIYSLLNDEVDGVLLRLLSVSSKTISIQEIRSLPEFIPSLDSFGLLNAISRLEDFGVITTIALHEDSFGDEIAFSHHTFREQISNYLKREDKINFIASNELSAMLIEKRLDPDIQIQSEIWKSQDNIEPWLTKEIFENNIDALTIFAKNTINAQLRHSYTTSSSIALHCFEYGQYHDAIELFMPSYKYLSQHLEINAPQLVSMRSKLLLAHYYNGNFSEAVTYFGYSELDVSIEAAYAWIISYIKEKPSKLWYDDIQLVVQTLRDRKDYLPWKSLINSAVAVAQREFGMAPEGEELLEDTFRDGPYKGEDVNWWKFISVAAIYLPIENKAALAQKAYDFFHSQDDHRSMGIVLNNIGMINLINGQTELALDFFERSKQSFAQVSSSEIIYPLNNIACLSILKGSYQQADSALTTALIRPSTKEDELTIRINLMLSRWKQGLPNNIDAIGNLQSLNKNTWLAWMASYATNLVTLKQFDGSPPATMIAELFEDLKKNDPEFHSANFWNNLLSTLDYDEDVTEKFAMTVCEKHSALDSDAFLIDDIIRPIFLSFGRM